MLVVAHRSEFARVAAWVCTRDRVEHRSTVDELVVLYLENIVHRIGLVDNSRLARAKPTLRLSSRYLDGVSSLSTLAAVGSTR